MGQTRRKYSREYKINTVELSYQRDNIEQLAAELDINPNLIHRWRKQYTTDPDHSFPGNGNKVQSESDSEVERLRRENAELKTERDILKKAVGIFTKKDG